MYDKGVPDKKKKKYDIAGSVYKPKKKNERMARKFPKKIIFFLFQNKKKIVSK
jgi:hypothetical protein